MKGVVDRKIQRTFQISVLVENCFGKLLIFAVLYDENFTLAFPDPHFSEKCRIL